MKNLTVLVLAGGSGSRFFPFSTNKLLFPFAGKPISSYGLLSSLPQDAEKIIFVVSKENVAFFSNLPLKVPYQTVLQPESHGMADAVLRAAAHITDGPLLILIGDDITDPGLPERLLAFANKTDAFAVLAGFVPPTYFPGGYLRMDQEKIVDIVEKPKEGNIPSPYVTISSHFFRNGHRVVEALRSVHSTNDDGYEVAITSLMKTEEFRVYPYQGYFYSLKYPWHVLPIMEMVLGELKPKIGNHVTIKDHVTIEGAVHIGDNTTIMEYTKIVGPTYIGPNTIVGNNNVIRGSHIGANCVSGFNTDITRSYIGDSCWFHSNYIGDSILEKNISMGSGAVLANLRLDEGEIASLVKGQKTSTTRNKLGAMIGENVRIGVNASIMPGVKIGKDSFVGAGVVLSHDIASHSFCFVKQQVSILTNKRLVETAARDQFRQALS